MGVWGQRSNTSYGAEGIVSKMENPFDEEFQQDAIGVVALLVAIVGGVISGLLVAYSFLNWFELLRGLVQ